MLAAVLLCEIKAALSVYAAGDLSAFEQRLANVVPDLPGIVFFHALDGNLKHRTRARDSREHASIVRLAAAGGVERAAVERDLPELATCVLRVQTDVGDRGGELECVKGRGVVVETFGRHYFAPATALFRASTSALLPTMSAVRSWMPSAARSRMRVAPFTALPPACSAISASGRAS